MQCNSAPKVSIAVTHCFMSSMGGDLTQKKNNLRNGRSLQLLYKRLLRSQKDMDDESSRGSENAIFLLWKHGAKEDAPAKMTRIYYLTLPFFMSWLPHDSALQCYAQFQPYFLKSRHHLQQRSIKSSTTAGFF